MAKLTPGQLIPADSALARPAFSPDGARLLAGDGAGALLLFERRGADPGAPLALAARVPTPASPRGRPQARPAAWSPDGALVATHEDRAVRLRAADGLAELASAPYAGPGPVALGGGGAWLATLGEDSVGILGAPDLARLRTVWIANPGGFEYFRATTLAADPAGDLVAVRDDGGVDETAMGAALRRGEPKVTVLDAGSGAAVGVIEPGGYVRQIAFDPWRHRIVTAAYDDVGVWLPDGRLVARVPLADTPVDVQGLAVSERWLLVCTSTRRQLPGDPVAHRLGLWDCETLAPAASAALAQELAPAWVALSPDGRTALTDERSRRAAGVRVWSVEG